MPRRPDSPSSSTATSCSSLFPAPHGHLTRARKLRHLQDSEVADLDFDSVKFSPRGGRAQVNTTASSVSLSVDINSDDCDSLRFSTAVPQPLPLPDLATLCQDSDPKNARNDAFRLLSPQDAKEGDRGRGKGGGRGTRRVNNSEVTGHDAFYGPSPGERSGMSRRDARINWDAPTNGDHVETWLSRNMPQNVDRANEGFVLQVPFRSAPATTYSSPILSPQRPGDGDLVSSYHTSYEVWSSPERLSHEMTSGFPSQETGMFSHESSPIRSPSIIRPLTSNNTSRTTSPVHPEFFIDISNLHLDNNGPLGGYPLPLPPGVAALSTSQPASKISALSSLLFQTSTQSSPKPQISAQSSPYPQLFSVQSSPSPHITFRPELLPCKNQWSKGKLIGRGTFGSVYVATNRETGALCAMKEVELCPDDNKCIESMKQLEQEINVLGHLKHPNIVQYYGSEIEDDKFYIYLEYVYPGSINKYVHEYCRAMTESVVRNFTRHILSGLAYLHSTKTIHRDIKGANLLVDAFGAVKLADFGMAKHLTGQVADLSFKGSPYWMAPELMQAVMQRDNSSALALAVDIWSLGCTVIEMFTARPPWSEYEGVAAMFKVLKESPPIPETLSAEGKDFLRCCFQRNPAHRPSASMLLEHPFVRSVTHLDAPYHLPTCNES